MKYLLLACMIFVASCSAGEPKSMNGEHLNGVRYVEYTGPDEVDASVLAKVVAALEAYAKERTDSALTQTLARNHNEPWKRMGFAYQEERDTRYKVGVRYEKGQLQCIVFANQISASFRKRGSGAGQQSTDEIYYIATGDQVRVTHSYSFPNETPFPAETK